MNKLEILKQIKDLFTKEQKFLDVKSGENIIRTPADEFEVGGDVFVVTPEGEIPAPDGEHLLDDGRTIIVSGGKLTEIMKAEEPVEVEVEMESELEIDEEEGKVKDEVMQKMKEAEDKIVMLEEKIKDIEEVVTEMASAYGKVSKYSQDLETKLENFMKSAPAEGVTNFKSEWKSESKGKKNTIDQKLEGFRSIRVK